MSGCQFLFQDVNGFSVVQVDEKNFKVVNVVDEKNEEVSGFKQKQILKRDFSSKHYWLPLKRSDTQMYPDFKQNPGWK